MLIFSIKHGIIYYNGISQPQLIQEQQKVRWSDVLNAPDDYVFYLSVPEQHMITRLHKVYPDSALVQVPVFRYRKPFLLRRR